MNQLISFLQARLEAARDDDRGATMVEYGLLVALISIAVVAVLLILGPELANLFQQVVNAIP